MSIAHRIWSSCQMIVWNFRVYRGVHIQMWEAPHTMPPPKIMKKAAVLEIPLGTSRQRRMHQNKPTCLARFHPNSRIQICSNQCLRCRCRTTYTILLVQLLLVKGIIFTISSRRCLLLRWDNRKSKISRENYLLLKKVRIRPSRLFRHKKTILIAFWTW